MRDPIGSIAIADFAMSYSARSTIAADNLDAIDVIMKALIVVDSIGDSYR